MSTEKEKPKRAAYKNGYYWTAGISLTAVVVLTVCCLFYGGTSKPEWLIALFTVVMTVAIVAQWLAMIEQNRKFEQQNRHMAEQNKVMIAQNEAIEGQLEQVQLEQRAWLATSVTTHGQLSSAYNEQTELDLPIIVRNEGRTPGVITHAKVEFHAGTQPDLEIIEQAARSEPEIRCVLGPDDMFGFNVSEYLPPVTLPKQLGEQIERGELDAYLAGGFIYTDTFGKEHKTLCSYKYNGGFGGHPIDGEMT